MTPPAKRSTPAKRTTPAKPPAMKVKWVDFADVEDATYNPRVDLLPGDAEWAQIEASLDEYGQVEPLVYNEANGRLIGGHQRKKILQYKGETGAHMSIVKITEESREKALNVALNQGGRWDLDKLNALMGEIDTEGLALIAGFDQGQLNRMASDLQREQTLGLLAPDRPGGATGHDDANERPFRQGDQGQRHELSIALDPEQRRVIFTAIDTAKELWGCTTQQHALTDICAFFSANAEQPSS